MGWRDDVAIVMNLAAVFRERFAELVILRECYADAHGSFETHFYQDFCLVEISSRPSRCRVHRLWSTLSVFFNLNVETAAKIFIHEIGLQNKLYLMVEEQPKTKSQNKNKLCSE